MAGEQDMDTGEVQRDFAALPAGVRTRIVELVAEAIGALPPQQLPAELRPIARFAPVKRARVGAAALLKALSIDRAFAATVRQWLVDNRGAQLGYPETEPVISAASAVLTANPAADALVDLLVERVTESTTAVERDTALRRADKLEAELTQARASNPSASVHHDATEADRLRLRLREQGTKLRVARDEGLAAMAAMEQLRSDFELEIKRLEADRDVERGKLELERQRTLRAEELLDVARQSAREARQADETRLSLLVDTMQGAISGLRTELALGGRGARPADLIGNAHTAQHAAESILDPAGLDVVLRMPAAHLIVDGYNVTKTAYPELPLADQRQRLARQLAALASRTNAEITVVFDGAGVVAHPNWPRGVRVLFSEPGVIADDVIRSLVVAEPAGRILVVASTDREVAESVRRRGAHSVRSAVLVQRLSRT